jgi:hypothetical protein
VTLSGNPWLLSFCQGDWCTVEFVRYVLDAFTEVLSNICFVLGCCQLLTMNTLKQKQLALTIGRLNKLNITDSKY